MKKAVGSILRVFGYLVAFLAVTVFIMGFTKLLIVDWEAGGARANLFWEAVLTTLGLALTNLLIFRVSRSSIVFRGWPPIRLSVRGFAKGSILGLVMASSMLVITIAVGGGRIALTPTLLAPYLSYVIPFGACLLVMALAEEWLFRGYPLTKLADVFGRGWANLLLALLFAAAHYGSSGFNFTTQINIVLGSLVVGTMRFTPGGIPAAWGFHFAWNFTQVVCGANLSLEEIDVPGVTFHASGSTLLSGGIFGPEAGIGATVATSAVLIILTVHFRRQGTLDLPIPLGRSRSSRDPHGGCPSMDSRSEHSPPGPRTNASATPPSSPAEGQDRLY